MTVKELRTHLVSFPDDLPVCYQIYSEYMLLDRSTLMVRRLQPARKDGWVHGQWAGEPAHALIPYLVFPGN